MFELKDSIHVDAPMERCFLLSTSIELVERTIKLTPTEGKTSGLIVGGDQLVWRGWKFGIPAMHQTLITGYDRPNFFQDTMGRGYFKHFQHDHRFAEVGGRTLMSDTVRFSLPFGWAGRLVSRHIVAPHVVDLLKRRFALLKQVAEGPDWPRYMPHAIDRQSPLASTF